MQSETAGPYWYRQPVSALPQNPNQSLQYYPAKRFSLPLKIRLPIDLGEAKNKADILKTIQEAEAKE